MLADMFAGGLVRAWYAPHFPVGFRHVRARVRRSNAAAYGRAQACQHFARFARRSTAIFAGRTRHGNGLKVAVLTRPARARVHRQLSERRTGVTRAGAFMISCGKRSRTLRIIHGFIRNRGNWRRVLSRASGTQDMIACGTAT